MAILCSSIEMKRISGRYVVIEFSLNLLFAVEPITIELIQLSGAYGRVLATYTTSAKDFLYPYPNTTSNSYRTQDRDVLMDRSIEFPVSNDVRK